MRFMFYYLPENTYTLPTILHWSNPFTLMLALTLRKWVISVWNHQEYENFQVQGTLQPMFYKQKKVSKKTTWGNLSTRKKLVTLISWCVSFSIPVFSDCGLASGQTYIPGVGASCLLPAWVPSRTRALGSAWGVMAHQKQHRCCHHPQWMAKPLRNILFPLFLHLPLACNHPPRKLCQPRRGGNSQERQQNLCSDFLHNLNFCSMKTSPAKNPSEGF